jgi:hypothetical protein
MYLIILLIWLFGVALFFRVGSRLHFFYLFVNIVIFLKFGFLLFIDILFVSHCFYTMIAIIILQLPEGRDFYHKTVFGTRNPAFWVGAVMGWFLHHTFNKVLNVVLISLFDFIVKIIFFSVAFCPVEPNRFNF